MSPNVLGPCFNSHIMFGNKYQKHHKITTQKTLTRIQANNICVLHLQTSLPCINASNYYICTVSPAEILEETLSQQSAARNGADLYLWERQLQM